MIGLISVWKVWQEVNIEKARSQVHHSLCNMAECCTISGCVNKVAYSALPNFDILLWMDTHIICLIVITMVVRFIRWTLSY